MLDPILHCGAQHVAREAVERAPTPAASKTWVSDLRGHQDARIRTYQETELSDASAHDLVVRALDAAVVPVTQLPAVLGEWREPSHDEFTAHGKTLWRLHNAITNVWKGRNLAALPRRSQALHGLFDAACGLAV